LFIVLEGVEGSGKSTQARLLGDWLHRRGIDHVVAREPGGTRVGEEIRQVLLHGGDDVPATTELLLMLAARAAFVDTWCGPRWSGAVVVADRYELSSFAYQGYGRGCRWTRSASPTPWPRAGCAPDLTIILDVSPDEGAARRTCAGGAGPDRAGGRCVPPFGGGGISLAGQVRARRRDGGGDGCSGRGARGDCTPAREPLSRNIPDGAGLE
jgi:dTMP kinase